MKIRIKKLHPDAVIPKYQTKGASGFDLHALKYTLIPPGETRLIKTGLAFDVGPGYEMQIRGRSGLTLKTPLRIHLGTLDSDYFLECGIIAWNSSLNEFFEVFPKDRIAQGVISSVQQADIEEAEELYGEDRGGGFGSTGV